MSDCEGYERILFGSVLSAPGLRSATMIIEVHEDLSPGVGEAIRGALGLSHSIEETTSADAPPRSIPPGLDFLTAQEVQQAMHEIRPPQAWLLLRPRTPSPAT